LGRRSVTGELTERPDPPLIRIPAGLSCCDWPTLPGGPHRPVAPRPVQTPVTPCATHGLHRACS
jgi:hypothetical protein